MSVRSHERVPATREDEEAAMRARLHAVLRTGMMTSKTMRDRGRDGHTAAPGGLVPVVLQRDALGPRLKGDRVPPPNSPGGLGPDDVPNNRDGRDANRRCYAEGAFEAEIPRMFTAPDLRYDVGIKRDTYERMDVPGRGVCMAIRNTTFAIKVDIGHPNSGNGMVHAGFVGPAGQEAVRTIESTVVIKNVTLPYFKAEFEGPAGSERLVKFEDPTLSVLTLDHDLFGDVGSYFVAAQNLLGLPFQVPRYKHLETGENRVYGVDQGAATCDDSNECSYWRQNNRNDSYIPFVPLEPNAALDALIRQGISPNHFNALTGLSATIDQWFDGKVVEAYASVTRILDAHVPIKEGCSFTSLPPRKTPMESIVTEYDPAGPQWWIEHDFKKGLVSQVVGKSAVHVKVSTSVREEGHNATLTIVSGQDEIELMLDDRYYLSATKPIPADVSARIRAQTKEFGCWGWTMFVDFFASGGQMDFRAFAETYGRNSKGEDKVRREVTDDPNWFRSTILLIQLYGLVQLALLGLKLGAAFFERFARFFADQRVHQRMISLTVEPLRILRKVMHPEALGPKTDWKPKSDWKLGSDGDDAPGLRDLPPDLLQKLLMIVDADDPCAEVVKLCNLNREWAGWCRDGWLYDAANAVLGYYGAQRTWEGVRRHYANRGQWWVVPESPKMYFQMACRARFEEDNAQINDARKHPFFEARLLHQVRTTGQPELRFVPTDLSNYGAIATLAVQQHGYTLRSVPTDRDDYGVIAKLAAQGDGGALEFVPTDRDDYGEIARLAVQQRGLSLRRVPEDRADYGAIAMLAVQQNGTALMDVPEDRDDYGEIARLAVQQRGLALAWVPRDRADFGELARLAVQQDGRALMHVHANRADFGELARLAVQQSGRALEFVPANRADFGELARLAVQQNGRALRYVPVYRADYAQLAWLALRTSVTGDSVVDEAFVQALAARDVVCV